LLGEQRPRLGKQIKTKLVWSLSFIQTEDKNKTRKKVRGSSKERHSQSKKKNESGSKFSNQRGGLFGSLCEAVRLTSAASTRRFKVLGVPGTEMLVRRK
jgi:hypothetical protein